MFRHFSKIRSLPNEQRAIVLASIVVLFWGTVSTAFKIGLRTLNPAQLIFIASVTTLLVLFFLIIFSGKLLLFKLLTLRQFASSALLGIVNPFLYYLVLFKAYTFLPAQVAQPINMIWPIVLVLLSIPILKHKIGWKSGVALLISFGGVVVISSQGNLSNLKSANLTGVLLCICSAFLWSIYWILNVRSKLDELIKLFINFLFGCIFLAVYISFFSTFEMPLNQSFVAGIYIGIFEIGVSFVLWMKAMSLTKHSARIANLTYIGPFLSLIPVHFILGEKIYITTVVGLFFIISGILFQQTEKNSK
jgi:drug/metabolite transporter (DMT)-like permease